MFIVCGVLYAIDSTTDKNTKIRLALDLYTMKLLDVTLSFTNPFRKTTRVGYNHRNKELYTWDKGNQLIHPVRCTMPDTTTSLVILSSLFQNKSSQIDSDNNVS